MGSSKIVLPFLGLFFAAMAVASKSLAATIPWLPTLLWGIGGALFVAWIVFDIEHIKRFFLRKGSKYGLSSGVSLALGILVLVGACFLANKPRFNKTYDVTRSGANTLSEQSLKIIDNAKEAKTSIEVVGFFLEDGQKDSFQDLLRLYTTKGLDAKTTFVNPQEDPTRARAENITQGNTVIVKLGKQEARITTFNEEKFTNAIVNVMKNKEKKVYFTAGHGEPELENAEGEGLKTLTEALKGQKYVVESLPILEKGAIPDDADLLVIAGPQYDFKDQELNLLKDYLKKAKPLLVMIDAVVNVPALNGLLKDYGISFNDDLLILRPDDPRVQLLGQDNAIISDFDSFNPVTKDFAGKSAVALLMPQTRSIAEHTDNPNSMKVSLVAKTSEVIIGINNVKSNTDLQNIGTDRIKTGTFGAIAVATGQVGGTELAENKEVKPDQASDVKGKPTASKELRIVAVGSSKIATNFGASRAENLNVVLNSTNYLLQDEDFISIRPKDAAQSSIDMTSPGSQLSLAFYTWIYPFVFLGFGLVHWLRRRRA
ncbi:MAG: GldG family protein [Oligoflexales bacterium]